MLEGENKNSFVRMGRRKYLKQIEWDQQFNTSRPFHVKAKKVCSYLFHVKFMRRNFPVKVLLFLL